MTLIEAAKQARDALEVATTPLAKDRQEVLRARAALDQAFAEIDSYRSAYPDNFIQPLTDEQIMEMYNEPRSDAEMIAFARAIEAKLKEKNT